MRRGAAIAQVGGQVEKVFSLERMSRQEALDSVREEGMSRAVAASADLASADGVEFDEVPLTYLPSNAALIRAKAAGDLVGG